MGPLLPFPFIAQSFRPIYDPQQSVGAAPVAGEQRKLAAIVAADVGYSPDLASHAVGPLAKENRQFLFGEAER
jgi:hypothetical protein